MFSGTLTRSADTGKLGIHVSGYKFKLNLRDIYVTIYRVVVMNHKEKISSQVFCLPFIFSWKFRNMLCGFIQIKDLLIIGTSCLCSITPPLPYILFLNCKFLGLEWKWSIQTFLGGLHMWQQAICCSFLQKRSTGSMLRPCSLGYHMMRCFRYFNKYAPLEQLWCGYNRVNSIR